MSQQGNWIWDATNKVWVKLAGTAGGAMSINAIVEELNDIEDVSVAAPTDLYILYWNDGNSKWECRAFTDWLHASAHENAGADEISVAGLSGELADPQPVKVHASDHTDGTDDIQDAAADDSTKGIATFEADDFDSAAGKIDLADAVVKSVASDVDPATPSAHSFGIKGGDGIDVTGAGSDITVAGEAASDTNPGIIEVATIAETNTGTDTGRAVSPDGLAGSNYGKRIIQVIVVDSGTALTTGDGKAYFFIPSELNGYNLVDADACVNTASTGGTPTVQIHNLTQTADMLSTVITIDENEKTSFTAATPPVIDGAEDDVATGDEIRIDVDVAGTGTKGLSVILSFQLP